MDENKGKAKLNDELLDKVSGGCGEVHVILGVPTCYCTGERVDMVQIRTDATGRIVTYQCPQCGATETVYE